MTDFSDYIVFVDETGDHGLEKIDASYPMFGLTFCVMRKDRYASVTIPAFTAFKFKYWGQDNIILHEHEIRKSIGPFSILMTSDALRAAFQDELSALIADAEMTLICSVIHKENLVRRYKQPWNPYEISLMFCLERLLMFLLKNDQRGKTVHVVFECRGKDEDASLELEFRRITGGMAWGYRRMNFNLINLEPVFAKKSCNSIGLQLADMTARPVALSVLRPGQPNRAFDTISGKITDRKTFP